MNSVYATYFNERPPARAVVEAARIPRDALVEIMMVAQRP
jgi:2-iminobutanoate/2-iminopropanoate deaminase